MLLLFTVSSNREMCSEKEEPLGAGKGHKVYFCSCLCLDSLCASQNELTCRERNRRLSGLGRGWRRRIERDRVIEKLEEGKENIKQTKEEAKEKEETGADEMNGYWKKEKK